MAGYHRAGKTIGALVACLSAIALAGCSSSDSTAPESAAPAGASAEPGIGTVPAGQPDINGDGKVIIGVLSPGDINDNGYYQSFVDSAETFATARGWTVIKRGSVNPAEALTAARAMCQQKVDMVALGASELRDAIPASQEPVCEKTAWYMPSSGADGVTPTPKLVLGVDDVNQSVLAAGYASALLMQERGYTKAGFVTGPEMDFAVAAAKAFTAGVKMVLPDAEVIVTYTGDLNDPAKGREGARAQIRQGVKVIYPYLGGATDAVAELANAHNVLTLTPGTDRCDSTKPKFDISVLFSPGDYLSAALESFSKGKLQVGVKKVWTLGVDPFPAIKLCKENAKVQRKLDAFISDVASKKIDPAAEVQRLGS